MNEKMNDEALLCISKCIKNTGKSINKASTRCSQPVLGEELGDEFPEVMHESVRRAKWTHGRIEYRFL